MLGDLFPNLPPEAWKALFAFGKLIIVALGTLALAGVACVLIIAWKRGRLPFMKDAERKRSGGHEGSERRGRDPMVHEMTDLVKNNTAAVQAFVSQENDIKSICLATCVTLQAVEKALGIIGERLSGVAVDARAAAVDARVAAGRM